MLPLFKLEDPTMSNDYFLIFWYSKCNSIVFDMTQYYYIIIPHYIWITIQVVNSIVPIDRYDTLSLREKFT